MRGQGAVYLRGKIWWVRFSWHGKEYRESAETADKRKAEKLLLKRLKTVGTPKHTEAKEQRLTLTDMLEKIELHYTKEQNRSFKNVKYSWPHLEAGFPFHRVVDIDRDTIERYQQSRLDAGAKPSTINRETAYLKLGVKLCGLPVPTVGQLAEDNARQGFLRIPEFNGLLADIADANVRDIVEFLYHSGWRSSEPKAMQWHWLDTDTWTVRLPAEFSKNKKARSLPLIGTLLDIIKRRIKLREPACPYVFHRAGMPIKSFRKAFQAAAKAIGQPKLVPHDMRRSAIRNFRKAGLSESEGMKLSGHRTNSVFKRYDIVDDEDARQAMRQAQDFLKQETERKVVPLKRRA